MRAIVRFTSTADPHKVDRQSLSKGALNEAPLKTKVGGDVHTLLEDREIDLAHPLARMILPWLRTYTVDEGRLPELG